MIELLVEHGDDVHARDAQGTGALVYAVGAKKRVVRLLIERGAEVDVRDDSGWTSLHFAAQQHCNAAAQLLLDKGADVNAQGKQRETPFSLAWGDDALKGRLAHYGGRVAGLMPRP